MLGDVASAVYGHPSRRLTIIGLTGTAGKTSTAYLVESGLRAAGHVTGLIGTVETRLGDLVIDSVRTTPEASDLHALFAAAVERGVTAIVMEVSSHALALGRVGGTRFAVGGYTNFGSDHLDFHGDADDYFAAKALLFDGRCDVEVLNADDPALVPLLQAGDGDLLGGRRSRTRPGGPARSPATATPSGSPPYGPGGAAVDAGRGAARPAQRRQRAARPRLPGRGRRRPADRRERHRRLPGRAGPARTGRRRRATVIGVVDYAHKADAIVAALAALRELATGRLICVLGAGGDRDRGKRPVMGAAAARGADLLIVTDDNPRTEDPAVIRAEVLRGAVAAGAAAEIVEVDGRRAAITEAVRRADAGRRDRAARQGPRTRPGDFRPDAPVRRPGRAGRRPARTLGKRRG